jgi:hypothetical protein
MLLPSMTQEEITISILRDWYSISKHDLLNIAGRYDKLRKKKKIKKSSVYCVPFVLKTKDHNEWRLFLSKAPSHNKYKGVESINYLSIVHYYSAKGLRVFKIMPGNDGRNGSGLHVFNGHFFRRYNERMELGLYNVMEMVEHYFINNGYSATRVVQQDDRIFTIGTCKSGFMLGEIQFDGRWLVEKTFISRNESRSNQTDVAQELADHLQAEIEREINKQDFDLLHYEYKADVMKGIESSR